MLLCVCTHDVSLPVSLFIPLLVSLSLFPCPCSDSVSFSFCFYHRRLLFSIMPSLCVDCVLLVFCVHVCSFLSFHTLLCLCLFSVTLCVVVFSVCSLSVSYFAVNLSCFYHKHIFCMSYLHEAQQQGRPAPSVLRQVACWCHLPHPHRGRVFLLFFQSLSGSTESSLRVRLGLKSSQRLSDTPHMRSKLPAAVTAGV